MKSPSPHRPPAKRRCHALQVIASVLFASLFASITHAAQVEIAGGFNSKENRFVYTVKNNSSSAIVQLEFPHFHADSMLPPDGWDSACTHLVGGNVPAEGGVCKATSFGAASAIEPRRSLEFVVHLSNAPADIGRGEVKVKFANGKEEVVPNVEISVKPLQGFGPVPIVVIAIAFVGYAVYRSRSRRAAPQRPTTPDEVI